jgi:hypothetical protein
MGILIVKKLLPILIFALCFSAFGQKSKTVRKTKPRNVEQIMSIAQKLGTKDSFTYKYDKFENQTIIGFQSPVREVKVKVNNKQAVVFYKLQGAFSFPGKTLNKSPGTFFVCAETNSKDFSFETGNVSAWAFVNNSTRISLGSTDSKMDLSESPTIDDNLRLNIQYKYHPCWKLNRNSYSILGKATTLEMKIGSLEMVVDLDDASLFRTLWVMTQF